MDAGILEQVLWHIHNWFEREQIPVRTCCIDDGSLPASITDRMLEGQWYRIEGSALNDGLHLHPAEDLADETFDGSISILSVPKALLSVVDEIAAWQQANGQSVDGPYSSESFGGYSYTLKSDGGDGAGLSGWRLAFRDSLNPWRKLS
jgi:hypothetical protein